MICLEVYFQTNYVKKYTFEVDDIIKKIKNRNMTFLIR